MPLSGSNPRTLRRQRELIPIRGARPRLVPFSKWWERRIANIAQPIAHVQLMIGVKVYTRGRFFGPRVICSRAILAQVVRGKNDTEISFTSCPPNFVLDTCDMVSHIYMKRYSISAAARLLGVHRATLHRWIGEGVVPEPVVEEIAGSRLRYWTEDGLMKLKKYKTEHYRKKPRKKEIEQRKRRLT